MSLTPDLRDRIERTLHSHRVVLFMKGDPQSPRCGFSAKAVGILDALVPGYASVDVLADAEIREGIKEYGQWPTIPQLYVDGELIGGSDIIEQMLNSGELHQVLGAPAPVKSLSVQELHDRIIAGAVDVIDVRPAAARALAPFPQPHEVLDEDSHDRLAALPKDLPLAFICHHGDSSRQAAEHFRGLGFRDVYNVEGGIDAWATNVDASVPRY